MYNQCPLCGSSNLVSYLQVKDYSVSQHQFQLMQCRECHYVGTSNAPTQADIAPYYAFENYISHTNTNKGVINKIYHLVRKRTLNTKYKLVKKYTKLTIGSVLDIGCGTGAFLGIMQSHKWVVTGIEPDDKARDLASNLHQVTPLPSNEMANLKQYQYHAVTMWHVLEHVHQLHTYFNTISTLLVPKGILLIAVPNYTSPDAKHYQQYWAGYDVPRHLHHFSPKSIAHLAVQHNFSIIATLPMWYDAFYVSMLSEKYKNGNLINAIYQGIKTTFTTLKNTESSSSLIYILQKNY